MSITVSQSATRHPHRQPVAGYTGVIHQDIDPAEVGENFGSDFLDSPMISDIDGISFRGIGTRAVDFVSRPVRIRHASTDSGDACAFAG